METLTRFLKNKFLFTYFFVLSFFLAPTITTASNHQPALGGKSENYTEYKGMVIDRKSNAPLAFASITVVGTNTSTVSNSEGEYLIKISNEVLNPKVTVSFIGYKNKTVAFADLNPEKPRIELDAVGVLLPEISVISKDAEVLIRAVLDKKGDNYSNDQIRMTAFYRETIKKNKSYVSLSESVVEIYKQPYTSYRMDIVKLYKARKKADYTKLDTVAFKLMGGPFNSLHLDVMKNPEVLFTENMTANYEFSFDRCTYMDSQMIYVLDFKQRANTTEPLYFGKLYIDAKNLALKTAIFSLNVENKELASKMFVMRKPSNADVYPTTATYRIDYREKDGKWYYGYSRIELALKMNWKRKLFKTTYYSTIEMATTDWEIDTENSSVNRDERLKPSVVISDQASGFSDPEFWGEYNVIEPDKSIESAIKKIQKQLEKSK